MAYIKKLFTPKCSTCRTKATVEVFNHLNSSQGTYCTAHGYLELRELKQREGEQVDDES